MKKCPTCDKTFDDAMRFCQTDGTQLVEVAEETKPEDPLKTMVVSKDEMAGVIPPSDPFKTMVASSAEKEEEEDLLQLPEEVDPMKTMVVPPMSTPEESKFESIKEEIQADTSGSSPFSAMPPPSEPLPEPKPDFSGDPTLLQPDPPKFSEPSLSPPSFGEAPPKEEPPKEDDLPATVFQNPPVSQSSAPPDPWNSSPFDKPQDAPIPSPFGGGPKEPVETPPSSPFETPSSPFDQPTKSPFDMPPPPSFKEPDPIFQQETPNFNAPPNRFEEPQQPFGQQVQDPFNQQPYNQGFNQPLQQAEWSPPPAPVQGWQDQGLGAQTPFQPPMAMQGQNQTLPIVSLVFGILSVCCYVGWLTGPVALITGYIGMKNVNNDPNQYGGKGLAIAGMIVGGVFTLIWVIYWIFYILLIFGILASGGFR